LSLAFGGLAMLLKLLSLWAGQHVSRDDFEVFLVMFLGASCFVWPVAIFVNVFAALAVRR
jgi:hypothetical protein